MSWYETRIAEFKRRVGVPRGQQSLFEQVCKIEYSQLNLYERIAHLMGLAKYIAHVENFGHTTIQLADSLRYGTACATFTDAPDSFQQPLILLDWRFFLDHDDPEIFIGLLLHELAHIKYTRLGFQQGKRHELERFLHNLLEDWRIERLLGSSCAAWKCYLERTRLRVFEEGCLHSGLADWDRLSQRNRTVLLLAVFLFAPEQIDARPELQTWENAGGINVFERLCDIFQTEPLSEEALLVAVNRISVELIRSLPAEPTLVLSMSASAQQGRFTIGHGTQSGGDSNEKPEQGDEIDCPAGESISESVTRDKVAEILAKQVAERVARQLLGPWTWKTLADEVMCRSKCQQPLDDDVIKNVRRVPELSKYPLPPAATGRQEAKAICLSDAPVQTTEPKRPDARMRYRIVARQVQHLAAKLRALFADPLPRSPDKLSGQAQGHLDPKRLYRVPFDRRVFRQPVPRRPKHKKTQVGLLLDGSGSMSGSREQIALWLGVILIEGLRAARNVDVKIFGHVGRYDQICEIQRLGDKSNAVHRLGCYRASNLTNFDDLAIRTVANELERQPAERRVLFVLTDALPFVCQLGHSEFALGVDATAHVVTTLRRRGWRVIGLTIETGFGEQIYGQDRVHVRDPQDVEQHFPRLLMSLFHPAYHKMNHQQTEKSNESPSF